MSIVAVVVIVAVILSPCAINWCICIEYMQRLADKDFVCPNCGCHFNAKWYQMIYKRYSVELTGSAVLRCPVCRKRDACSVAYYDR